MGVQSFELYIQSGEEAGVACELPRDGVFAIGSSPSCHLQLLGEGIQSAHCFLKCSGGKTILVIRHPEAVVLINGVKAQQKLLAPQDLLSIGGREIVFREASDAVEEAGTAAAGEEGSPDGEEAGRSPEEAGMDENRAAGGQESPDGSDEAPEGSGDAESGDPLIGVQIGGYLIEEFLGRGAMGTVYRAKQLTLDRPVALKILSTELTSNRDFIGKFLREARSAARLNHPHVVPIYDAAQEGEYFYFSMEFLAGGTLAERMKSQGRLPIEEALRIGRDAMKALVYAESQKIIHRDIKPDNLLIASDGTVKIADLGIAIERHVLKNEVENKWVGSPRYMAPEQSSGMPIDHRADIYALGSTLYRVISGVHPFTGKTAREVLRAKAAADAPPLEKTLPGTPKAVSDLVKKMMARDPGQRYQTCEEALHAVEGVLAALSPKAAARTPPRASAAPLNASPSHSHAYESSVREAGSRKKLIAAAIAVSAILVLGVVVWALMPPAESSKHPADSGPAASTSTTAKTIPKPVPNKENSVRTAAPTTLQPNGLQPIGDPPSKGARETASTSGSDAAPPPGEGDGDSTVEFRELGDIKQQWFAGLLDNRKAYTAIEEFRKKYPNSRHSEEAQKISGLIRDKLSFGNRSKIDRAVTEEVEPLIRQSRYSEAAKLIANLLSDYPENKADLDAAAGRIDEAIRGKVTEANEASMSLVEKGDFEGARKVYEDAASTLPEKVKTELEGKVAELRQTEETYRKQSLVLDEKRTALREACSALDFPRARSVVGQLPSLPETTAAGRLLAKQKGRIEHDLQLCENNWKFLQAGITKTIGEKTAIPLAFQEDPIGTKGSYIIKELSGSTITVQSAPSSTARQEGKPEKHSLFSLVNQYLVILSAKGSGENANISPPTVEGVGLIILYAKGPFQSRDLLTDSRLGSAMVKQYGAQLKEEEEQFLALSVSSAQKRLGSQGQGGAAAIAECKTLADDLLQTMTIAKRSPVFEKFRVDLVNAFVQARNASLRAQVPDSLFHGKVKSYTKADNKVQLNYLFASEAEREDFVTPAKIKKNAIEVSQKQLKVRGEFRFLDGDVFKNRLAVAVTVPANGYNQAAPNINIAMWTRDNDAVSAPNLPAGLPPRNGQDGGDEGGGTGPKKPKNGPDEDQDADGGADVPNDYFVFGVGYKTEVYNSRVFRANFLNVSGLNTVVPMPANALFGGVRGKPLHSLIDQECLWGVGVVGKIKGQQAVLIRWAPDNVLWSINTRPAQIRESKDLHLLKKSTPFIGSFSIFTHGELVHFAALTIEGELNPDWIESRLDSISRAELARIGVK